MKNECAKTRSVNEPYEVYANTNGFEWRVLKKYQNAENEAKNSHAKWFVACKSPFTMGGWEYGDEYVSRIKSNAHKVS